ncbi:hypothetical protein T492DRAFT_992350 [Pavlovales sp. CCMP2436]|nr:hypothetical protein T492DRAFT_992350 [Pavlovales sp. CCMP2436]|mmetsp:Transcript_25594/g.65044  ORF Transcript_25594/g.65044 Transcript_25594/m.65044 type:complete len:128 (-) Transcript_25594:339-722(-)
MVGGSIYDDDMYAAPQRCTRTRERIGFLLALAALGTFALTRARRPCAELPTLDPRAPISDAAYRQTLYKLPMPTCDVLMINPTRNATLLFKRANRPVKGVWYSLGGRVLKNETLAGCPCASSTRSSV